MVLLGEAKSQRDHVMSGSSDSLQQGLPYLGLVNNYRYMISTVADSEPPWHDGQRKSTSALTEKAKKLRKLMDMETLLGNLEMMKEVAKYIRASNRFQQPDANAQIDTLHTPRHMHH